MRLMIRVLSPELLLAMVCCLYGRLALGAVAEIDITQTSIEELLKIKITSASKVDERVTQAPAAIFVLTAEDIRRSGVTSIPEALRLVPGVQVARIDANKWAVSIRGFNSRTANKLLVLVDGRSIYDPLFTGVLWETKDVMLEDVHQIEVIRGPGGALWGANAVNGVINIITKNSADTLGGLVAAAIGSEERDALSVRYGLETSERHAMRFYAKTLQRDEGYLPAGAEDDSEFSQGGFRYDALLSADDKLLVQGDFYEGEQGTANRTLSPAAETSGHNVFTRWRRNLAGQDEFSLQFYYDHTEMQFPTLGEERDTFDIDFQYQHARRSRHKLTWGLNFRQTSDDIRNTPQLSLIPQRRTDDLQGAFVQDEIALPGDKLFLTLGSKWESNDYTGSELLPNIRLNWQINSTDIFWAAISKAVRTPSRLEQDFAIPLPGGEIFTGGRNMDAERLTAYESGYRFQASDKLYLDLAAFFNHYERLLTIEGLSLGNKSSGDTYGLELAAVYTPAAYWKVTGAYTYLNMDLKLHSDSLSSPAAIEAVEGSNPEHQVFMRLGRNIGQRQMLDITLRYVDALPAQNVTSYYAADLRWAVTIGEMAEFSLTAQNLFADRHFEQQTGLVTQVEGGIYAKWLQHF